VGTLLGKDGTYVDPGFTEYSTISKCTVMTMMDGVVTLDCGVAGEYWWSDMEFATLYTLVESPEPHSDTNRHRHVMDSKPFGWKDVGVHTVRRHPDPDDTQKLAARERVRQWDLRGKAKFGGWWQDQVYVPLHVCVPYVH
jgi:hypothetical protein